MASESNTFISTGLFLYENLADRLLGRGMVGARDWMIR